MLSLFSTFVLHTVEYGVGFLPIPTFAAKQQASDPDFSPPTTIQPAAIESPAKVVEALETKVSLPNIQMEAYAIRLTTRSTTGYCEGKRSEGDPHQETGGD